MSQIKISEAKSVQFPMVKHASSVGWEQLAPEEAEGMRRGRANMLFTEVLDGKLIEHVMCRRCGEIWERPK